MTNIKLSRTWLSHFAIGNKIVKFTITINAACLLCWCCPVKTGRYCSSSEAIALAPDSNSISMWIWIWILVFSLPCFSSSDRKRGRPNKISKHLTKSIYIPIVPPFCHLVYVCVCVYASWW